MRQVDKAVAVKTNSFRLDFAARFVLNLIAFEFGNLLLVKSTETGLNVFFQLDKLLVSVSAIEKLNFCST